MRRRSYRRALAILACALIASACATSDSADATLHVLVTNDDGVHAPGIDVLVQTLEALPDVDVRVIAPADNRSGTGETRSTGELIGTITTTASGHPAVGVVGYPADTLSFANRRGVLGTTSSSRASTGARTSGRSSPGRERSARPAPRFASGFRRSP